MADSFEQLRLEFLAETEDTLEKLQRDLNRLGQGIGRNHPSPDVVDRVFRTTHSLKGVAGMFGLDEMSAVSHVLESVFDELREGRLTLDDPLLDLLYQGNESLHRLLSHASGRSEGNPREEAERVTREIEAHLRERTVRVSDVDGDPLRSALNHLAESEREEVARVARAGRTVAVVEASFDEQGFEDPFRHLLEVVRHWGTVHGTVPGERDPVAKTFRIRLIASGEGDLFPLLKTLGPLGAEVLTCDPDSVLGSESTAKPPPGDEIVSGDDGPHAVPASEPLTGGTLRVPVDRVDRLLQQLGDLIQAKMNLDSRAREVLEASADRHQRTMLNQSLRNLDRRIRTLQGEILQVRMVTLANQYQKLERTLRETCRSTGKEARLVTVGEEVELDKQIVEALIEPLVHLVRNAVDHGLEPRAERVRAGKDPVGTVRIEAHSQGGHTILEVSDDGTGLDLDRIRHRAHSVGVAAEGTSLSRSELLDLIFHPGFTVREEATEISGRGVGLDVVRSSIIELGGHLEVESGPSGSLFRLRIPTTLAITNALLVGVGRESFCIPLASVTEVAHVARSQIEQVGSEELLLVGERAIPLRDLGAVLALDPVDRSGERVTAVILGLAERRLALLVDHVGGQREIVVRSLGPLLPAIPGISGSTELGDGRTVLILDAIAVFDLAAVPAAGVEP